MEDNKQGKPNTSSFKRFYKKYKRLDIFGQPISFTYKGHRNFTSYFGATISILEFMFVVGYLTNELSSVYQRNPTISVSNYYQDLIQNPQEVKLTGKDFDFAVQISSVSGNQDIINNWGKYVTLSTIQFDQYWEQIDGQKTYMFPMKYYDMIICPEGRFDNFTSFIENVGITTGYYCMNETDITLRGSMASETMTTYYINVAPCNQTTNDRYGINQTCETNQTLITEALQDIYVIAHFMSKYFNTHSYEDYPLEPYVYSHFANLNPLLSTMQTLHFKRKIALGTNSYLSNSLSAFEYSYYETKFVEPYITSPSGDFQPYLGVGFFLDPEIITTNRYNYSAVQAFSSTGGIAGLLHLILKFLVGRLYQKMFPFSASNEMKKDKKEKLKVLLQQSYEKSDLETSTNILAQLTNNSMKYSYSDYVKLQIKRLLCFKQSNNFSISERLALYKKALRKFNQNFDFIQIIKRLKVQHKIMKSMITENNNYNNNINNHCKIDLLMNLPIIENKTIGIMKHKKPGYRFTKDEYTNQQYSKDVTEEHTYEQITNPRKYMQKSTKIKVIDSTEQVKGFEMNEKTLKKKRIATKRWQGVSNLSDSFKHPNQQTGLKLKSQHKSKIYSNQDQNEYP